MTKAKKSTQIKEWKLDKNHSFKPAKYHVINVDMKTRELWVYSHFYMTMVTFVGKTPKMTMSKRVFDYMFTYGHWVNNWKEVTDYYKIRKW